MFTRMRGMTAILLFSLGFGIMVSGCAQAPKTGEILFAAVWPFAGGNNLFNEGIDLAVREINAGGGIKGRELKLLKEDDSSQVVKGVAIAEALAGNPSVLAVIGHRNSFVSIPAAAIYEQAGLTMLSPASTAPGLTQNNDRYIFRSLPGDNEITGKLAGYLAEQGLKRLVIYYSADDYGRGLADSFEDQAKARGIAIVDRFNYYAGEAELKRLHSRWRAFGFDAVFVAASLAEGVQLIKDAGQAGIKCPFVTGNALDSPELAVLGGEAAEGTIVGSVFNPGSSRQEVRDFTAAFRQAYGQAAGAYAALGYDAVKMLAAAAAQSGGADREAVARGLRNLGPWPGVCGRHELSPQGDDLGDLVVLKELRGGELIPLAESGGSGYAR